MSAKGSTVALMAMVRGVPPIYSNTRGLLRAQWSSPQIQRNGYADQRGKTQSKLLVRAEVGSQADGMRVVVEKPSPGSQPWERCVESLESLRTNKITRHKQDWITRYTMKPTL